MRTLNRLLFPFAVIALVFAMLHIKQVSAQQDTFNLVTSPLPVNLTAKPGSTLTTDIRVKNAGTRTEKIKVSLMKFSAFGEEGKPSLQDRGEGDDYFDWVTFSPQVFDAPQNEWITVKMTIKLPKTAAFGYYYAPVFSRADKQQQKESGKNTLIGSTAVLVLVDADVPNAKRSAKIQSFTADKKFYEYLPTQFTVKIHNDGNVHVNPSGNIFIKRGNKTVATLKVNGAQGNVLPNSNRIFTSQWNDGFPVYTQKEVGGKALTDEKGNPVTELRWDYSKVNKLKIGHYSAHLLMAYDNGKQDVPMEAVVSFWVVPWRLLALFIGVPLLLVGLIIYLYITRWRIKKKLRQLSGTSKKASPQQ